jgi:hypothetical protein
MKEQDVSKEQLLNEGPPLSWYFASKLADSENWSVGLSAEFKGLYDGLVGLLYLKWSHHSGNLPEEGDAGRDAYEKIITVTKYGIEKLTEYTPEEILQKVFNLRDYLKQVGDVPTKFKNSGLEVVE